MISTIFANVFGTGIAVGLFFAVWKANARRWGRLARAYEASNCSELVNDARRMQTVILTGGDIGWNSYKGITTVAVSSDGLVFRIMIPFSMFHPTLLVPFREISVAPAKWYLIGKSFRLTFAGVENVQMIIDDKLMEWIEQQSRELAGDLTKSLGDEFHDAKPPEVLHPV